MPPSTTEEMVGRAGARVRTTALGFADHGSDHAQRAVANIRAWAEARTDENIAVPRSYIAGTGPFPERAAVLAVVGGFLAGFADMVGVWADWAAATVDGWPNDPRRAEPDRPFMQQLADRQTSGRNDAHPAPPHSAGCKRTRAAASAATPDARRKCYSCSMARVPSRELRNDTAGVLRRAAGGEPIEITVNGEAVARIAPLAHERSHWTARADFVAKLARIQADPGLTDDLAKLDAQAEDLGPIR